MSAQQEAKQILEALGAEIEEYGNSRDSFIGTIDAPPGYVWEVTDTHSIAVNFHTDRKAAWESILSDLRKGVVECTDEDCEVCEDNE